MAKYYRKEDIPPGLLQYFQPVPLITQPCVVLDPFAGTAITGVVAIKLQRKAVLIELSESYCGLAIAELSKGIQVEMAL